MACLKCGKKTTDEQSFCPDCLKVMEQYPVKPDVHVQLPNRPETAERKKSTRKRRVVSYEEATVIWRRRTRWLAALVLVLMIMLGIALFLLAKDWLLETLPDMGTDLLAGRMTDGLFHVKQF